MTCLRVARDAIYGFSCVEYGVQSNSKRGPYHDRGPFGLEHYRLSVYVFPVFLLKQNRKNQEYRKEY